MLLVPNFAINCLIFALRVWRYSECEIIFKFASWIRKLPKLGRFWMIQAIFSCDEVSSFQIPIYWWILCFLVRELLSIVLFVFGKCIIESRLVTWNVAPSFSRALTVQSLICSSCWDFISHHVGVGCRLCHIDCNSWQKFLRGNFFIS